MNVTHRLADGVRSVVAYWTPTPSKSQFVEKGTLTPAEFLNAGDQLTFKFPTWKWKAAVSKSREVSWLTPEKQYLVTFNVPCRGKVRDLDHSLGWRQETEGDWVMPGDDNAEEEISEIQEMKGEPPDSAVMASVKQNYVSNAEEEEEAPDIATFEDVDKLVQEEEDPTATAAPGYFVRNAPDAEVVKSRTFDVTITYDKYYQTPRIWLFGYDENGVPLKTSEVFEYILTEYASKTVTVDPHPCTGIPTVSIHPCNHASVMHKVVQSWIAQGLEPRHDLALFVLLKFISSVIPTIQYDFTMDIDMFLSSRCSDTPHSSIGCESPPQPQRGSESSSIIYRQ